MSNKNTLNLAEAVVGKALLANTQWRHFKDKSQLLTFLKKEFDRCINAGDYSYDPNKGEIGISIEFNVNFHEHIGDQELADIVVQYFLDDGWENISIVNERQGVTKALFLLRSKTLTANELRKVK